MSTLPPTMHALVLEEPGRLSYREVPVPVPGEGEVLIRVKAATTCGTDVKAYLRGHPQIPMPGILGHEYAGVVVAVGEDCAFEVGDEVMGVHSAPCQECYWCLRDQENLCESIMETKVLGSYAEYLLIPKRIADINLFLKPEHLDFEIASLLEPLSCVTQGLTLLPLTGDSKILVIGPGAIGLMFAAALQYKGYDRVLLAGRTPERLAIGEELGIETCLLDDIPERPFDIVIECTGTIEIWERSFGYVRRGGTLMLFGGCPAGTTVCFDTKRLHYDQISIISPFHFGSRAVALAREWLSDSEFNLRPLISGERPLAEAATAFEDLRSGRGIKYVFKP